MKSVIYKIYLSTGIVLFTNILISCEDQEQRIPSREVISIDAETATMDMIVNEDDLDVEVIVDQMLPPPHLENPKARLFLSDPINDDGELTEVTMTQTTSELGILTSDAVQVFNCLNEEGGITGEINMGFMIEVSLCREAQTVRPDPDGHYLSIDPPEDFTDPNDQFAELMMYHHVNEVADYFEERHDFVKYDTPLPALVNVQLKTNPALPFDGLRPGPDGFIPLDNALFFPKESWEAFAQQFGLPARDTDLIVFFQGIADFSYDASVIYHEYTHAVIGIDRLQGYIIDQYGIDSSPGGMNEGLADYFGGTVLDNPSVGKYGIGSINGGDGRSLDVAYQCPNDTHWEVHVHGRVIGSTMWAIREAIGQDITDRIMFDALELFNANTTHQEASELILVEAEEEGAEVANTVREILLDYGMLDCVRSRSWSQYSTAQSRDGVPYSVLGTQSVGIPSLRAAGVPAHKQFNIIPPVEPNTAGVKLSWKVVAQGSGFGAPPEVSPLRLAFNLGDPVEVALRPARYITDQEITPSLDENDTQHLFIPSQCFQRRTEQGELADNLDTIHTLFINSSSSDVYVTQMGIEWLTDIPNDLDPVDCVRTSMDDQMAGEAMAGEAMAGEAIAGEAMAGEAMAGEAMAGEAMAGEAMAGEAMAGEAVAGEAN